MCSLSDICRIKIKSVFLPLDLNFPRNPLYRSYANNQNVYIELKSFCNFCIAFLYNENNNNHIQKIPSSSLFGVNVHTSTRFLTIHFVFVGISLDLETPVSFHYTVLPYLKADRKSFINKR